MNPEQQLILCGTRRLDGATLRTQAARAATGFLDLGVKPGDAVAVMLRNDLAYLEAMLALGQIGAHLVAVNWHFRADEAGFILHDCGARVLVVHADLLPQVADVLPESMRLLVVPTPPEVMSAYGLDTPPPLPPGALHWSAWRDGFEAHAKPAVPQLGSMLYTSGTTGRPKAVMRLPGTPRQHEALTRVRSLVNQLRDGMRTAVVGPLYHAGPNSSARVALERADVVVVMPRWDAEELLGYVQEFRLTHLSLVPIMLVRLLKLPDEVRQRYDVSSLEQVVHGGSPCPPEAKRQAIAWLGDIVGETYGSTEAGLITVVGAHDWLQRPGTVGRPIPGTSVRILDSEGQLLPAGQVGEIHVDPGDNVLPFTYRNNEAERREIERDGHFTNGDMGYLDADGFLFVTDRRRDMVISGGVNIYLVEIENELLAHPGVADCAVFGIPDDEYGEALAAGVVPAPDCECSADTLREWLRERIAGYKVPKVIELRSSLPRDSMGKVFKNELRAPYWRNAGRRI